MSRAVIGARSSSAGPPAKVPGFISRNGPSALWGAANADGRLTDQPVIGGMIFIDLFGPDGVGHGQVTHVGIVEYVEGTTVAIVKGNGKPDPSIVTRTTIAFGRQINRPGRRGSKWNITVS
jgi:hypothetical protein